MAVKIAHNQLQLLELQLFRSDMPDPYAGSSSSMSPASFRDDRRHGLAGSSTGSLPQLEASEDALPSASALLFEAPEEDGKSMQSIAVVQTDVFL